MCFSFVRKKKTRIWISRLAVKAISLSVIFRECTTEMHMKDLKASQPVDHHGGELPVANDLVVLVRLFHATRDELQFLENCMKLPLHAAERQRCRSLLDCRRSSRQRCAVRRPTVKDRVNYLLSKVSHSTSQGKASMEISHGLSKNLRRCHSLECYRYI